MEKTNKGKGGHVSGNELLEGIREYALERFGPMTMTFLDHGTSVSVGLGEIVFNWLSTGYWKNRK